MQTSVSIHTFLKQNENQFLKHLNSANSHFSGNRNQCCSLNTFQLRELMNKILSNLNSVSFGAIVARSFSRKSYPC